MDIFTLRIHRYNIIEGEKETISFCKRMVPIPIILRSIAKYGIVWWEELRRQRGDLKEMRFMAVTLGGIIYPPITLLILKH